MLRVLCTEYLLGKDWDLLWPELLTLALPLRDFTLLKSHLLLRFDMSFEPLLCKQERRFQIHVNLFAFVSALLGFARLATTVFD